MVLVLRHSFENRSIIDSNFHGLSKTTLTGKTSFSGKLAVVSYYSSTYYILFLIDKVGCSCGVHRLTESNPSPSHGQMTESIENLPVLAKQPRALNFPKVLFRMDEKTLNIVVNLRRILFARNEMIC